MSDPAWMLDTNALSELIRKPSGPLTNKLSGLDADAVCTSIVVACELRFGTLRKGSERLTQRVGQMLAVLQILPFDQPADQHDVDIRVALGQAGTPLGSHDLLIAAHARSRGLTLVTRNLREFMRVPGLRVEDWQATQASAPETRNPSELAPGGAGGRSHRRRSGGMRSGAPDAQELRRRLIPASAGVLNLRPMARRSPIACFYASRVGDGVPPAAPSSFATSDSARFFAAASISIGRPHSRAVSPGHLFVASRPILPPSPLTGDAKSR